MDGSANDTMVAAFAAISGQTSTSQTPTSPRASTFSGTRQFDERTGYRSQSFLTVPMRNDEGEIIGVLQLINANMPSHDVVVPFSKPTSGSPNRSPLQAVVADRPAVATQFEALFESFIELISLAIDDKSPYTGEHCQRVPELTMTLAEAADETTDGLLADFVFCNRP